ncbi:MAG: protein-disulfide reductase DsbD family protein [Planctomycetota bacterium]|nr:protein-disulfide reductase DsbD family protein [Planctomycetota bacterium]
MRWWAKNNVSVTMTCLMWAALLCLTHDAKAQFTPPSSQQESASDLVSVSVTSDLKQIAPGQPFQLAFVFSIKPGWHIYWTNPGASGAPTSIKVSAPEGFAMGDLQFTRPITIGHWDEPDGLTYGYEDKVVLFVPVVAPESLKDGEVTFEAHLTYLVCKNYCLFGDERLSITIPTTKHPSTHESQVDPKLLAAMKRLPKPLLEQEGAKVEFRQGQLIISMQAGHADVATFFPIERPGITFGKPFIHFENDRLHVQVDVEVKPQNAIDGNLAISGVLGLGESRDDPSYAFVFPVSNP